MERGFPQRKHLSLFGLVIIAEMKEVMREENPGEGILKGVFRGFKGVFTGFFRERILSSVRDNLTSPERSFPLLVITGWLLFGLV
jgi:hypothetical protein